MTCPKHLSENTDFFLDFYLEYVKGENRQNTDSVEMNLVENGPTYSLLHLRRDSF